MPLYDPDRRADVPPELAAQAVHDFLQRCRQWAADVEIPKRLDRVAQGLEAAEAAKLHEWIAYLKFTEHALAELERGELDHWFTAPPSSPPTPR